MPVYEVSWWGSLIWVGVVAVVAFAVSWRATEVLRLRRTPYVAVLAVVTTAVTAVYVAWYDVDAAELVGDRWVAGIVAGVVVGAGAGVALRRMPATLHRTGRRVLAAYGWEGVVYGVAEGILLSALPALIAWEGVNDLGWDGAGGQVARGVLPVLASAVVIVTHHLGYWDYRNRLLVPVTVVCGALTVAYLVTGSLLAPVVGHVVIHAVGIRRGVELPPHERRSAPASGPARTLTTVGGGTS